MTLWRPYVPDVVLDGGDIAAGTVRRLQAAALFVDVAGFTELSEALGRAGRAGTEQLTDILNSFFDPAIELIAEFEGGVVTFGGDALSVLFPVNGEPSVTARNALQCALDLQVGMGRFAALATSAGTFTLAVKVGAAIGPVVVSLLGVGPRLMAVAGGPVLDFAAEAEHSAALGEVLAHRDLVAAADGVQTADARGDYARVTGIAPRASPTVRKPRPAARAGEEHVFQAFVHPVVARRVATRGDFVDEHRTVTTVFVNFARLVADDATDLAYLMDVMRVVKRFGGHVIQADGGDKGSKALAVFGAPVAHDDDEARAVMAALALREMPGPALRIGVSTGRVFCGHVGSLRRREYTVMGDAVNLAARLMQAAAWGQILLAGATRRAVRGRFRLVDLPPLQVKGKVAAVEVAAVEALVDRPAPALLVATGDWLLGRSHELAWATRALDDVTEGRGRVLGVRADPGMGKSRLAAEVALLARQRGVVVHAGAFDAYGTQSSYLGWRDVWWSLLGLSSSSEAVGRRGDATTPAHDLPSRLADAVGASLAARVPLLGPVLGVDLADNDLTRGLEPALRAQLLRALLLTCLADRAAREPLLIVLEDCHWIDEPSQALLEHISRNAARLPVGILTLSRPPAADATGVLAALLRLQHVEEVTLTELDADSVRELVQREWRRAFGTDPSEDFIAAVAAKAAGNPLFVEGIVELVSRRGAEPNGGTAVDLPDSLANVVLARIDQLDEPERITLKLASVFGRRFSPAALARSYPAAGSAEEVRRRLDVLDRLALTTRAADGTYTFRNGSVQDVAYDSLTFATRESLHESVGDFLEATSLEATSLEATSLEATSLEATSLEATSEPDVDLLAYHYGRSRNTAKQHTYFTLAGHHARKAYANDAAIGYYERLGALGPPDPAVLLDLGSVYELVGRWPDAERCYREVAASAADGTAARAAAALGFLLSRTPFAQEALPWLDRARDQAQEAGDVTALSDALHRLAWTHLERSDFAEALACAREQLRLAGAGTDHAALGGALENLGVIEWRLGDIDEAVAHLRQVRDLGEVTGDERLVVHAANNLGGIAAEQGDFGQAVAHLEDAAERATRIGYEFAVGEILGNEAELRLHQGDHSGALVCAHRALHTFVALGDPRGAVRQAGRLAGAVAASGDDADADLLYRRAIELGRRLDQPFFLADHLQAYAERCAAHDRLAQARAANAEAVDLTTEVQDDVALRARLLAVELAVRSRRLQPDAAVADLRALLPAWPQAGSQAAIHYALWQTDATLVEDQRRAALLYEQLHQASADVEHRERYRQLTGERLADPPVLPPLPGAPLDPGDAAAQALTAMRDL